MTTTTAGPLCPACSRGLHPDELDRWLCGACLRAVRAWLAELPAQLVVLRGSRLRETTDGPRVAGSRTPPLPGRLDTLNLLGPCSPGDVTDPHGDQHGPLPIAGVLGSWVRLVAEDRHLEGPQRGDPEHFAAWLGPHLDWAAGQPWATELHTELQQMMRTIRGITRVRPRTRAIPRPCPSCATLALAKTDWQTYVECQACGSLYTDTELADTAAAELARLQREEQDTAA